MSNRGQRTALAAFWAVAGTCLASLGCDTTMGQVAPGMPGPMLYQPTGWQGQPVNGPNGQLMNPGPATSAQAASAITQVGYMDTQGMNPQTAMGPGSMAVQDGTGGPMLMSPEGMPHEGNGHGPGPIPVELAPSSHPPHTVAPPDILYIDSLRLIPRPPYRLEPLDQLQIVVTGTLNNQPIAGIYTVLPDGKINLGFSYGAVPVAGMTVEQAQDAIRNHLKGALREAFVSATLLAFRGVQQTRGEHLVRPDGTISLGTYGSLYVAGMTVGQIKCLLEQHLSKWFLTPQVSVDIAAYNSKFYYVIIDGGGYGQSITKLPITGNEYVLDAIANIQGLPPIASKRRIMVSRPAPCGHGCYQILPVDWRAITEGADTCTNYQLFPGDRVFVYANRLIAFDNRLAQIFAPIERILGLTLLTSTTANSIRSLSSTNGSATTGLFLGVGR